jgi:hypothetical protein
LDFVAGDLKGWLLGQFDLNQISKYGFEKDENLRFNSGRDFVWHLML